MILIYDQWAGYDANGGPDVAFKHNGLGSLFPSKCTVTETINGEYELALEHPIDQYGKWQKLQKDRIIKVDVPSSPDPIFEMVSISQYRIASGFDGMVPVYSTPTRLSILGYVDPREELILYGEKKDGKVILYHLDNKPDDNDFGSYDTLLESSDDGWACISAVSWGDVNTYGYIQTKYLRPSVKTGRYDQYFVSSRFSAENIEDGVTLFLTAQLFRIYNVEVDLAKVTVNARHISYDVKQWPIVKCNVNSAFTQNKLSTYSDAFVTICEKAEKTRPYRQDHNPFTFLSSYADEIDLPEETIFQDTNLIESLLGSGSLVEKFGGEIFRNNYAVLYMEKIGSDRGFIIRSGKNLNGVQYKEDWSETVTHILAIGSTENSENLYIDGSSSINYDDGTAKYCVTATGLVDMDGNVIIPDPMDNDPIIRTKIIRYSDANTASKLKKAAEKEFEEGIHKPKISVTVDYINVGDTEEYKQYKFLQGVFLGDIVHVIANTVNVDVSLRVTKYTFNCLTGRYDSLTIGVPEKIDLKV